MTLSAPFPWFGGKRQVADEVWSAFGDVVNYVEPFAGSLAVLLWRPEGWSGIETVNDKDGFICNFWRALAAVPTDVTRWADWPVNENDLHARHSWLVAQRESLTARLEGDPEWFDAKIAGWWVWGICCWIGGGWCSGKGPWQVQDGQLANRGSGGYGVSRRRVHLGSAGQGVHRGRVRLMRGTGVHQRIDSDGLSAWFEALSARLRYVRVCCGDWTRVCGPMPTVQQGLTGVFLDPPYDQDLRSDLYATDERGLSATVREWAVSWGNNPLMRIVLCGYEGEHDMPSSWRVIEWKAHGGYSSLGDGVGRANAARERLWCSPHCLAATQGSLFPLESVREAVPSAG